MAKTRAFTSQQGRQMVSAEQIARTRRLHYNGQPTGERYYSTHKPGQRRLVKHVLKGSGFFAYIEGGGNASASDGESLNHILFKEALASLERVRLSLYRPTTRQPKRWVEAVIRITSTQMEKPIERAGGAPLFADVYLEFEDPDDVGLGMKWEGRLYLEIRHTHATEAAKQVALRDLGVPVVEVGIPDLFAYRVPDDETSDETEAAHRRRIKSILESEQGFLQGTVLSDPSSKAYLEVRNQALRQQTRQLRAALAAAQEQLQALGTQHERLSGQLHAAQQHLAKSQAGQKQAVGDLAAARAVASGLREQRTWLAAAGALLTVGFVLALLW
ncbi:hypothetical protein [Xanthomonas hortorum]|uniref:hypothetical protein n=1 Tax=Xanthomonas hortorum TaxID=56454 RepID=UPI000D43C515|nr:hypothetical protein [Xanthomonas hortorum]MCE4369689.1 hypothetical protein [Xanthomonas hortorum pv. hederae]PPU86228.1 hypothetical protein XhhCFBP4925_00410 [Xanthomonas hortorum pv. hederae]